jgi:hypothetical protein
MGKTIMLKYISKYAMVSLTLLLVLLQAKANELRIEIAELCPDQFMHNIILIGYILKLSILISGSICATYIFMIVKIFRTRMAAPPNS